MLADEDSPKLWMVGELSMPVMPSDGLELTPNEAIRGSDVYNCCMVCAPVASIWARSTATTFDPTGATPRMLVPVTTTVSTRSPPVSCACAAPMLAMAAAPSSIAERKCPVTVLALCMSVSLLL